MSQLTRACSAVATSALLIVTAGLPVASAQAAPTAPALSTASPDASAALKTARTFAINAFGGSPAKACRTLTPSMTKVLTANWEKNLGRNVSCVEALKLARKAFQKLGAPLPKYKSAKALRSSSRKALIRMTYTNGAIETFTMVKTSKGWRINKVAAQFG